MNSQTLYLRLMHMKKRLLILILSCLVSCEKQVATPPPRPVKAIQIEENSSAARQLVFPGTLRAFRRADLSFRIDGTVIRRDVNVGQKVKRDDVLIELDPREYELAVKKAEGQVKSMHAQVDFAGRDYERMKAIYDQDPGAISVSFVDRKKETYNQLQAELAVANSELDKATDDLKYTFLKAPFDGVISALYVENHEQVRAKQVALRLIDSAEREMEINVPEKYIHILLGNDKLQFDVYLDVFPDNVFPASIKEIGSETSSTTQTYPVTLSLHDIPINISLLAGMSGRAVLAEPKLKSSQAFEVPKSAVSTDNLNRNYVWVVDPNAQTVHKKEVELETGTQGDFAIIRTGLSKGDWVVTAGTSFLSEGQKVTLVKP